MATDADTCATLILPRLYAAGESDEQFAEQRRIVAEMDTLKRLQAETAALAAWIPAGTDESFKGTMRMMKPGNPTKSLGALRIGKRHSERGSHT